MANKPPKVIYLQWYGSGSPDDLGEVCEEEVTWCREKIFEHDFKYVLATKPKKRGRQPHD